VARIDELRDVPEFAADPAPARIFTWGRTLALLALAGAVALIQYRLLRRRWPDVEQELPFKVPSVHFIRTQKAPRRSAAKAQESAAGPHPQEAPNGKT
jgi:hypothetical protein